MKPFQADKWKGFIQFCREVPWIAFTVSVFLLASVQAMLWDIIKEIGGLKGGFIILFCVTFILIFIALIFYRRKQKKLMAGPTRVIDKPNPAKFPGLILMVSNLFTAREAIKYHMPELRACWLVSTPGMKEDAEELKGEFSKDIDNIIIRPIKDEYDTRGCYELIREIYRGEAVRLGLDPKSVISDITGGTKPMTVAMLLATLEAEFPLEHIPAEFDPITKKPIGPLPPIQISVDLPPWSGTGSEG